MRVLHPNKLRQISRSWTTYFEDSEVPALTQPWPWIRFAGEPRLKSHQRVSKGQCEATAVYVGV
jgi:hypothetical protein